MSFIFFVLRWVYVSQLNQMMAYRAQINLLMRNQCNNTLKMPTSPRKYLSMGAVYWQLNDVWSAPTWSTIDAAGQWKMAHYGAVRECFNTPIWGRIAWNVDRNVVQAHWIPNTSLNYSPIVPAQFVLHCYTIHSFIPTFEQIISVNLEDIDATCPVLLVNTSHTHIKELCRFGKYSESDKIIYIGLKYNNSLVDTDGSISLLGLPVEIRNWPPNAGRNGLSLESIKPVLPTEAAQNGPFLAESIFQLTIRSKSPELFIWLNLNPDLDTEFWFNKNGFHLVTSSSKEVILYCSKNVTVEEIETALWIEALSTVQGK